MKVVILAGGYGTRLAEETKIKPKPLVRIGDKPIIWHIMKIYSYFGINDFIICLGYKGHLLKNELNKIKGNWKIVYVNTGLKTMTGGRIRRIKKYLKNDNYFCLSYGDGLSDVNIKKLINFHIKHKKTVTLTAVRYKNPKGVLNISKNRKVTAIKEKPMEYINGGFFVLSKKIFKYLKNDKTIFEREPLSNLADDNNLMCFKHNGFWHAMDTLNDKRSLDLMWKNNKAPWKRFIK